MSIKTRIFSLWNKISNYGNEHYQTKSEIKANIISNQILAFLIMILFFVAAVSLFFFFVMLKHREENLPLIFTSYFIIESFIIVFAVFIFFFRNRKNNVSNRIFYDSLALYFGMIFILFLSVFVGSKGFIYFAFFNLIPLPFFILDFKQKKLLIIHEGAIVSFLILSLLYCSYYQPMLPLPSYFDTYLKYIVLFSVFFIFFSTSYFLWRQTNITENDLVLEKNKSEKLLQEVIPKLKKAEKKYRHLVENTSDIIFSLDKDFNIKTVNNAFTKHLHYKIDNVIGTNFLTYLHSVDIKKNTNHHTFVQTALEDIIKRKNKTSFFCYFSIENKKEAFEVNLSLEYSESQGNVEILAKGSPLFQDKTIKYLTEEKKTYEITNDLQLALLIGQKVTANLKKSFSKQEISFIEVALREMIINAIEHGNLNIKFEEKTKALEKGAYERFISRRQKNPKYKHKKVSITYSLDEKKLTYVVKDEGAGFSHRKQARDFIKNANDNLLSHGRGITMARGIFDEVKYNQKGNQVTLIKYIKV